MLERSDQLSGSVSNGWQRFRIVAESLSTVLFPASCRLCESPLLHLSRLPVCKACINSIQPFDLVRCNICGEAVNVPEDSEQQVLCGMCRRAVPQFTRAFAYGSYDGGLRGLIHLLKYQQIRPAAELLGGLLASALRALEPAQLSTVLVVPVPLSRAKARQRGFNQAELLSRTALKHLNKETSFTIQLHSGNLRRIRSTVSQTGLTSHQRRKNVRGAFSLSRPEAIRGRNILLIDDVYTTGTTLNECARVLRSAGAEKVWVATVARVLRHGEGHFLSPDTINAVEQDQGRDKAGIAISAKQA